LKLIENANSKILTIFCVQAQLEKNNGEKAMMNEEKSRLEKEISKWEKEFEKTNKRPPTDNDK